MIEIVLFYGGENLEAVSNFAPENYLLRVNFYLIKTLSFFPKGLLMNFKTRKFFFYGLLNFIECIATCS